MGFTVLKWDRESDGDATHTPTRPLAVASEEAERSYRHKLAQQLMKDSGRFVTGKSHVQFTMIEKTVKYIIRSVSSPRHILMSFCMLFR